MKTLRAYLVKLWAIPAVQSVTKTFYLTFVATFAAGFLGVFTLIQTGHWTEVKDAAFALLVSACVAALHASERAVVTYLSARKKKLALRKAV